MSPDAGPGSVLVDAPQSACMRCSSSTKRLRMSSNMGGVYVGRGPARYDRIRAFELAG